MVRRDLWFWVRIALTAVVVNVPIAVALVLNGVPMLYGGVLSAVAGAATLLIWDGARSRPESRDRNPAT